MKAFRHTPWFWYAVIYIIFSGTAVRAGELVDRDFEPQNYEYSDHRDFYVYVPDSYDGETAVPMVMVLHGCHQNRDTIINEFGWDEVAEAQGFILVAPDISTNDLGRFPHCWGYWEDKEIHQGGGEVEDLHRIGLQVEQEWRIDANRRHIAGLSSGAFMTNAAAVAHNEYWASAGIHSGGGYQESAATYSGFCETPRESSGSFNPPETIAADMRAEFDDDYTIAVMLVHSTNDCAVGYGVEGDPLQWGGLTSNRDAWLTVNGGALFATVDCTRDGVSCSHYKYGAPQRSTVEVVSMVGLIEGTDAGKGHYWSGGKADGQWTKTQGPKAAELFWDFFQRHPRLACATCPAPPTALRATDVAETSVSLSWNANSESNLIGYRLYRDGSLVRPEPITPPIYTDTGLEPAKTYRYHVTAVNSDDEESLPSNHVSVQTEGTARCRSYSGTITEHVAQKRAYSEEKCIGWWCWFWPWPKVDAYYATGSDESLGTDANARVTLYTVDDENFSTTDCNTGG
jgi:poly(hydroxyalkanoate) depolymerase family esterase